jgi:hypothetical protein
MSMIHRIDLTGDYKTTIYAAARRLLAGGTDPDDTVETWRGGVLSMSGGAIGGLAQLTVAETPRLRTGPHHLHHDTRLGIGHNLMPLV